MVKYGFHRAVIYPIAKRETGVSCRFECVHGMLVAELAAQVVEEGAALLCSPAVLPARIQVLQRARRLAAISW